MLYDEVKSSRRRWSLWFSRTDPCRLLQHSVLTIMFCQQLWPTDVIWCTWNHTAWEHLLWEIRSSFTGFLLYGSTLGALWVRTDSLILFCTANWPNKSSFNVRIQIFCRATAAITQCKRPYYKIMILPKAILAFINLICSHVVCPQQQWQHRHCQNGGHWTFFMLHRRW